MFLGQYALRLDDKGRLFLPAKFRDELAGGVVVTRGQDGCLFVYPAAEFHRRAALVSAAPQVTEQARRLARTFFSDSYDQVPDRQGRITVPGQLRPYASLERDCTVVGAGGRVELWDTPSWEAGEAERAATFSTLQEEVLPGLL